MAGIFRIRLPVEDIDRAAAFYGSVLSPSGEGIIAENRPNEFISIRHVGFVANGFEDTRSDAVREWAPAYENYSFASCPEGTRVVIDQDVTRNSSST